MYKYAFHSIEIISEGWGHEPGGPAAAWITVFSLWYAEETRMEFKYKVQLN